jgi:DNA-binding transcriptional regulator GbsR (MarR family)
MNSEPRPSTETAEPELADDPRSHAAAAAPAHPGHARSQIVIEGLDEQLAAQIPNFELFFKTVGFKRVHGRIWGLLVLIGRPLAAREISAALGLSQGATSTVLHDLTEWGAITSEFDSARRCHVHAPVSNTLSIAATVLRRREQVVFQQFKIASTRILAYVQERHGDKDPRVLTLRSIISTCEIAEAVMNLLVGAVANALDDSESLLHKAVSTALKVGVGMPARRLLGKGGVQELASAALDDGNAIDSLDDGKASESLEPAAAREITPAAAPKSHSSRRTRPHAGDKRRG